MNPYVTHAHAISDFELLVTFDNQETRCFDIRAFLDKGAFAKLREPSEFRKVRVIAGSVEWECGLDLSYDTLYLLGKPTQQLDCGAQRHVAENSGEYHGTRVNKSHPPREKKQPRKS